MGARGDEQKAGCVQQRCHHLNGAATLKTSKKRRVQNGDAPSNRTFGNCLLGVHCSQKLPPGSRANAGFPAVAGRQQENQSTSCPQAWVQVQMQVQRLAPKPQQAQVKSDSTTPRPLNSACPAVILDLQTANAAAERNEVKGH
jgi:hypothetical protein